MSKIYIPTGRPSEWKELLADPIKHWRTGYSTKALAYCWQEARGFPNCVKDVFKISNINLFQDIELLLAFPEYKVPLPGGKRSSQNDIFILARGNNQLITIAVEGKVAEDFGQIVAEWKADDNIRKNKGERLNYLIRELKLEGKSLDEIHYQLLHRTASAIIEAKRFTAENSLMIVHSFSQKYEHYEDYETFIDLYGLKAKKDALVGPVDINGINLYFAWIKGENKYLDEKYLASIDKQYVKTLDPN